MFICINNDFNTKNLYLSSKQKNKITKNDYYYNFIYNDELINMKTIYVNTGISFNHDENNSETYINSENENLLNDYYNNDDLDNDDISEDSNDEWTYITNKKNYYKSVPKFSNYKISINNNHYILINKDNILYNTIDNIIELLENKLSKDFNFTNKTFDNKKKDFYKINKFSETYSIGNNFSSNKDSNNMYFIDNNSNEIEKKIKFNNKIFIRISGLWESENKYGLIYKLFYV